MKKNRLGALVIVQNDAETIERSISSYYPFVDCILVSTDPTRGWSGDKIIADNTIEIIKGIDKDNKVQILRHNFCRYSDPMENDTYQRQFSADAFCRQRRGLDWILQVDADEVFLDFPLVASRLEALSPITRVAYWRWIQLFNVLDDGRYLVVVDENDLPVLERFPLAHRPGIKLEYSRYPKLPKHDLLGLLKWTSEGATRIRSEAVLHYSYAKSEGRIREKLKTWSHGKEFDTAVFFEKWLQSKTSWAEMKNFHPLTPDLWPRLKPFSLDELRNQTV